MTRNDDSTFPDNRPLSESAWDLWKHVGDVYTQHPGGVKLQADDFLYLLGKLYDIWEKSVELEKQVPKPPPEVKASNVIPFNSYKKRR